MSAANPGEQHNGADPKSKRPEFLLEMYKQLMADINRHIVVVWQSVGVVVASFAVAGFVEKRIISESVAATLVVAVCVWSLALLIEAGYWYNRNLCIIANIERQFLFESDLKDIHYYFGAHRPKNRMITTLRIQGVFSATVAILVLLFHFVSIAVKTISFSGPLRPVDYELCMPYALALAGFGYLKYLAEDRGVAYEEFLQNSPGIHLNTSGVKYGSGHGHGPRDSG